MAVGLAEAQHALAGVLRLARFDRRGIVAFDPSVAGCRRSFWAYVVALPFFVLGNFLGTPDVVGEAARDGGAATALDHSLVPIVMLSVYVLNCVAFPLSSLPAVNWLGRGNRWPLLVTGYNWLMLGSTIAGTVVLAAISLGMPSFLGELFYYFVFAVEAFMFEAILEIGLGMAVAFVLLDFILGQAITAVAGNL